MKKKLFFITFLFWGTMACAQRDIRKFTFIIVMDNDFPSADLSDTKFLIRQDKEHIKDSINFHYLVGSITLSKKDYKKLFDPKNIYGVFLEFTQRKFGLDTEYNYKIAIPFELLNKIYNIIKIYNKYDIVSREEYYFKPEESYIAQVVAPGYSTILMHLKK